MRVTPMSWACRAFAVATAVTLGIYVLNGWVPRLVTQPRDVVPSCPPRRAEDRRRRRGRTPPTSRRAGRRRHRRARGARRRLPGPLRCVGLHRCGTRCRPRGARRGTTSCAWRPSAGGPRRTWPSARSLQASRARHRARRWGQWDVALLEPSPGHGDLRIEEVLRACRCASDGRSRGGFRWRATRSSAWAS